jgi:hypothetical protein
LGKEKRILAVIVASIQDLEAALPGLVGTGWSEESIATDIYNCIAFAFGDTQNWWWPGKGFGRYWPPGFPNDDSVVTLVKIFGAHGYFVCDSQEPESGYEKVVIYARDGKIKHASRQLRSGRWASKLGEEQDIEHERAEHAECSAYGTVEQLLRRKREDWI